MTQMDYKTMMKKVEAPDSLKERVFEASRKKRPRGVWKPVVCTAMALAIVVSGAGFSNLLGGKGGPGNSFGLVAYAAETDNGSIQLTAGDIDFPGNGGGKICDFGSQRIIRDYGLNLACTGDNIVSLDYSIEGGAVFSKVRSDVLEAKERSKHATKEAEVWDESLMNPYQYLPTYETFTQFSIKPGEDLSAYLIRSIVPVSAEEEAALLAEKQGDESGGLFNHKSTLYPSATILEKKASEQLSASTISVTARFADGSSQTKRYRFSAESYLSQLKAFTEAVRQMEQEYYGALDPNASDEDQKAAANAFVEACEELQKQYPFISGGEVD